MIRVLALLAILVVPAFAPAQRVHDPDHHKHDKVAMPEGGSSFVYIALGGAACVGAAVWASRSRRRAEVRRTCL